MGQLRAQPYVRCMVLIPAGPDTVHEYLNDTIESVNHHVGASACIVAVIDDSRQDRFARLVDSFPNVVVIKAIDCHEGRRSHTLGSLFAKQVHTLKRLIRDYRFDVLLRMDTDALMIGDAPHDDVLNFMASRPDIGMVGAFKRRGDGSDKTAAMATKGRQLTEEMRLRHGLRNPGLVRTLRRLVRRAEAQGYTRGDMCTGGAFFMRPDAIMAMDAQGLFDVDIFRHSRLMDDLLFGLLCSAAGYRLADLPEGDDVLAINWRGLPMPVETLVAKNKKIVHPVKSEDPGIEARVRAYFRERRSACIPEHRRSSATARITDDHEARRLATGSGWGRA